MSANAKCDRCGGEIPEGDVENAHDASGHYTLCDECVGSAPLYDVAGQLRREEP